MLIDNTKNKHLLPDIDDGCDKLPLPLDEVVVGGGGGADNAFGHHRLDLVVLSNLIAILSSLLSIDIN